MLMEECLEVTHSFIYCLMVENFLLKEISVIEDQGFLFKLFKNNEEI